MENADGYVLGLGTVRQITDASREVTLLTPLSSLEEIDSIHNWGMWFWIPGRLLISL
jgi:hypothetical protein